MAKQKKYYLTFKKDIKKSILSDAVLLTDLSENLETNVLALSTMFKRNSQTLMHISLLKLISKRKKIEVDSLTDKISELHKKEKK